MSTTYEGSHQQYEVVCDSNVMMPMRYGLRLATDLYFPAAGESKSQVSRICQELDVVVATAVNGEGKGEGELESTAYYPRLRAKPGWPERLLILGPPTEKFAIRYVQAHQT